jgi:hypothetical protein
MTKPIQKISKPGTFMGIEGAELEEVGYVFEQESDSCQRTDVGQSIKIFTQSSGTGSYIVIKTKRWAMDADDIDKFAACLKKIVNIPEAQP